MSGNRISDMTSLGSLPASGARVPVVKNGIQTNYSYDIAAKMASLDANDAALAAADVAFTAADAALAAADAARPTSAALAATSGAGLMGLADGSLLSSTALKARRLFYGTKSRDTSLRSARLTADAIHTIIQGYAKTAGGGAAITGGYGKQLFIVNIDGMDPTVGSYSAELVNAAGRRRVLCVVPRPSRSCRRNDRLRSSGPFRPQNPRQRSAPHRHRNERYHGDRSGSERHLLAQVLDRLDGHQGPQLIFAYIEFAIMPGLGREIMTAAETRSKSGWSRSFRRTSTSWRLSAVPASELQTERWTLLQPASPRRALRHTSPFRIICSAMLTRFRFSDRSPTPRRYRHPQAVRQCPTRPTMAAANAFPKALGLAMVDVVNPHHQMLPWRRDEPSRLRNTAHATASRSRTADGRSFGAGCSLRLMA
jgi:hypothetical protein